MHATRAPVHRLYTLIKESVQAFIRHGMSTYASALAYQFIFSLFPFILFLMALLSFFQLNEFFDWLRQQAQIFFPQAASDLINEVVNELRVPQKGLLSIGAATALWLASRGIRAMMTALNVAYRARESRPAWKRYPLSILYTLCLAAMLVAAAALLIVGPRTMSWLTNLVGMQTLFLEVWEWVRIPVAVFLMMLAVAIVYHFGPNVKHRFRFISAGAVISILTWIFASLAFGYYVKNFSDYSVSYGSIGAVIVLLLYLYISAAALLFGAEVNAVIEHRDEGINADRQGVNLQ